MAPRKATQRPAPSQSQLAGPSRTQGKRRLAVVSDDDDDEGEEIPMVDGEGSEGGDDDDDMQRKVNDLVRLALFSETRRMPLKREDMNKKAIQNPRHFNKIFAAAQVILDQTFGLELQELPSKAGLDQEATAAVTTDNKKGKKSAAQATQAEMEELEEVRGATVGKRKVAAIGSKTYILRSKLHPALIEHANRMSAEILEEEAILDFGTGDFFGGGGAENNEGLDDDDNDDAEMHPRTNGSILSWSQGDQLEATGILHVVLALILVNGRVIDERLLRTQLKELGLPSTSTIHYTTLSTQRSMKIDELLSQLLRQGYLDRQVVGEVMGAGRKRVRGKVGGDGKNDGNRETFEWRWGPRALCEIGEKALGKFIAEFMTNPGADAEDEDENEERKKAKLERMFISVEKAAGGSLADVRRG